MANFKICKNVIAVDGPDGIGKSTFCQILKDEISKTTEAVVVRVTSFSISKKAAEIGKMFDQISPFLRPYSLLHNRFYLLATRFNYRDAVMQIVNEGKTVIIDSSELRLLAFIKYQDADEAYRDTVVWFQKGKLTYNLVPERRIMLFASPEDILFNLEHRNKKDYGDPVDINSVKRMIDCYHKATKLTQSLQIDGQQQLLNITNPSTENVTIQLKRIAQKLIGGQT